MKCDKHMKHKADICDKMHISCYNINILSILKIVYTILVIARTGTMCIFLNDHILNRHAYNKHIKYVIT